MDSASLLGCERIKSAILSEARAVFAASLQTFHSKPLEFDVVVESTINGISHSYKARVIAYDCSSLIT
ncbi:predicted protein [Plenodomus lingam JN3]|uniref:Predicted protein n=2 Tax=Leptosphaeria maculans TaxID=5022 RepID=E4ZMJ2_LEPMJ|nr:predicted protein [Plenodomus lingam JN3]CBX92861.1 predicted protein [Plenodomus lingam JN3]